MERLVTDPNGNVVNHIVADANFPSDSLPGYVIHPSSIIGGIGGTIINGIYTAPPAPPEPEDEQSEDPPPGA